MTKTIVFSRKDSLDGFAAQYLTWLKFKKDCEYIEIPFGLDVENAIVEYNLINRDIIVLGDLFDYDTLIALEKVCSHLTIRMHKHITKHSILMHPNSGELNLGRYTLQTKKLDIVIDSNESTSYLIWHYLFKDIQVPSFITRISDRERGLLDLDHVSVFSSLLNTYSGWTFDMWKNIFGPINGNVESPHSFKHLHMENGVGVEKMHGGIVNGKINGVDCVFINASPQYSKYLGESNALKTGKVCIVWSLGINEYCKCDIYTNNTRDMNTVTETVDIRNGIKTITVLPFSNGVCNIAVPFRMLLNWLYE